MKVANVSGRIEQSLVCLFSCFPQGHRCPRHSSLVKFTACSALRLERPKSMLATLRKQSLQKTLPASCHCHGRHVVGTRAGVSPCYQAGSGGEAERSGERTASASKGSPEPPCAFPSVCKVCRGFGSLCFLFPAAFSTARRVLCLLSCVDGAVPSLLREAACE